MAGKPNTKNIEATCAVCGTLFMALTTRTKYCSTACSRTVVRENARLARLANPEKYAEKSRKAHLKMKYGLSQEGYQRLWDEQKGLCKVCGQPEKVRGRTKLAVDHDHKTGEIYGLLCWWCNHKVIGRERDPDLFLAVSNYLRKGTGLFVPEGKENPKRKRKKRNGTNPSNRARSSRTSGSQ